MRKKYKSGRTLKTYFQFQKFPSNDIGNLFIGSEVSRQVAG